MTQAMRNPRRRGVRRDSWPGRGHIQGPYSGHFRGRQHVAAIIAVAILAVVAFQLFPNEDVVVVNGDRTMRVQASLNLRQEALDAASVKLNRGDRVLYAHDRGQMSVAVHRASTVNIEVDDEILTIDTHASTVSGALAAAGVTVEEGDALYVNGSKATTRAPLVAPSPSSPRATSASLASSTDHLLSASLNDPQVPLITVVRARPVTVVIDTTRIELSTAAGTVGEVLEEMGTIVREGDLVRPPMDAYVMSGMTIEIAKARSVQVIVDGEERTMYTQAETVGEILELLEIEIGPEDSVEPSPQTPVTEGLSVTINRTRTVEEEVEEPIAPWTEYATDPELAAGETRVEEGTAGVQVVVYRVTYRNGEAIERERVAGSARTVREAEPRRVVTGTKPAPTPEPTAAPPPDPAPSAPSAPSEPRGRPMTVLATWYNASHGGKSKDDPWYGITATGAQLRKGICATDPSVIPLGTRMYVPGYGECLAADTGGGVRGHHIDLGFPESAVNPWGTKTLEIYILD